MAVTDLTLLDVAKAKGTDAVVGMIEENLNYAPEARIFPFRTIDTTSYKTFVHTGLPTTAFRNANEGVASSKSAFRQDLVECYLFGGLVKADKSVAATWPFGGVEAYKALEASAVMKSALIQLGSQIWYGTTSDAKGFPGLKAFTPYGGSMVVDATGTGDGSVTSSVFLVKFGTQDVTLIGGMGNAFQMGEWFEQLVTDSGGTNQYRAICNTLDGWIGLQTGNVYCVSRICNLATSSGKTLTDAMIGQAIDKFPVGMTPDAIFMSRRSRSQLRTNRTATTAYGGLSKRQPNAQDMIVDNPTEAYGIPIYVSDSIVNTSAVES